MLAPLAVAVATLCTPRSSSGWWVTTRSAPRLRASSMTASVGSTANRTRATGCSRSPDTNPTWSQDCAVDGG